MNNNQWNPWKGPRKLMRESNFSRYGVALVLPLVAVLLIWVRPSFAEAPFFIFLAVIVLSAANGGLAPAFLSTAVSSVLIRLLFVSEKNFALHYGSDFAGMERMVAFVLVALMVSSAVAAIRRERNMFRDAEERYRLLAETASDTIIVIDEYGEILYANAVAEQTFATQAKDLVGKPLTHLLPGGGYEAQLSEMKKSLDTRKKPVVMRLPGLSESGEHLLIEMTLRNSVGSPGTELEFAL